MAGVPTVASTDGVTLAVHDLGGAGPTLLLSHATGLHGTLWAPFARSIPDHHAYALDYRGHGDATAPASGRYHWSGFRDDLLAVVGWLGTSGPLDGVGHSMGGAVLLMAELARPGTFRALALYEPIVFPALADDAMREPNLAVEGARRRRVEFASREAALANFSTKPPLDALSDEVLERYVDDGFAVTPEGTIRLKCDPETEARTFENSSGYDTFERLGEIGCPVLVMSAPPEEGRPAEVAETVAQALPRGEWHQFDDLGHFGPLEDPSGVAKVVEAFFRTAR